MDTTRRWTLLVAAVLALSGCAGGEPGYEPVAGQSSDQDSEATGTPSATPDDPEQAMLEFAECMREHGVEMDDPGVQPAAEAPEAVAIPDDDDFPKAMEACGDLMPTGGDGGSPGDVPEADQERMLAYARCMRENGVDMPDPEPGGGMVIEGPAGQGPDEDFEAADEVCRGHLGLDGPGAGLLQSEEP